MAHMATGKMGGAGIVSLAAGVGIGDGALEDFDAGRGGGEVLAPTGGEVIEHADGVPPLEEPINDVRADEARAAGDQESSHGLVPPVPVSSTRPFSRT